MSIVKLPYLFQGPYLLPLCDLFLLGRTRRVPIRALVDSGAVVSVFPRQAAKDAGITLLEASGPGVVFGGSIVPSCLYEAELLIQEHRLRVSIAFVERLEFPYALLGRRGVFARFREVSFLEKQATPLVELRS